MVSRDLFHQFSLAVLARDPEYEVAAKEEVISGLKHVACVVPTAASSSRSTARCIQGGGGPQGASLRPPCFVWPPGLATGVAQ